MVTTGPPPRAPASPSCRSRAKWHRRPVAIRTGQLALPSGVPVVINTSFNVRGEPIVCTPQDAYDTFVNTGIDV
ncbi:MAG: hypothetical protein IIC51_12060, partial [Planctomycetes bacterium]|nr:hypothetical protein [Planctomycetota bacterium]